MTATTLERLGTDWLAAKRVDSAEDCYAAANTILSELSGIEDSEARAGAAYLMGLASALTCLQTPEPVLRAVVRCFRFGRPVVERQSINQTIDIVSMWARRHRIPASVLLNGGV
jgi:hypothetical protein